MKLFFVAVTLALTAVSANAAATIWNDTSINAVNPSFCSSLANGNYYHPDDCNKFVSCSNRLTYEMDCPICHVDTLTCPDGRLVFDEASDKCLFADETTCTTSSSRPTSTTTQTTSTDPPPSSSSTTQSTSSSTTAEPTSPPPGGSCDPDDCITDGYCKNYTICDPTTKTWVGRTCGLNLVWNPFLPSGRPNPHGGNCDNWSNLLPVTRDEYRNDPDCGKCYWEEIGECGQTYKYLERNSLSLIPETLSCGNGLVFSKAEETCIRCQDKIKTSDGNTCTADCLAAGNV